MTNFEHMKQKIVETIMGLDEMELLRLAEDTEMCMSGMEGVFNCTIARKNMETVGTASAMTCTVRDILNGAGKRSRGRKNIWQQ